MKIKYLLWVIACAVIFFIVAKPATADLLTEEQQVIALGESLPHSIVIVKNYQGADVKSEFGHGTGFYISPHEIITDEHVVHDATKITTADKNGKECPATVYYADSNADLALLDTTCEGTPLELATSFEVGQTMVMMGNPETEQFFMTKGIVSEINHYFVGFDATTIPGNSGGPIVNLDGQVLGVCRWVYRVSQNVAMATNNDTLSQFIATVVYLKSKE